jgi:hypothetical protein
MRRLVYAIAAIFVIALSEAARHVTSQASDRLAKKMPY